VKEKKRTRTKNNTTRAGSKDIQGPRTAAEEEPKKGEAKNKTKLNRAKYSRYIAFA
jgi:hypothetical protein